MLKGGVISVVIGMFVDTLQAHATEILGTALATAGSIASYLHNYTQTGVFSWKILLAKIFIGGFAGYMMISVADMVLPIGSPLIPFAGGIGGVMGWDALLFLAEWFKKKID